MDTRGGNELGKYTACMPQRDVSHANFFEDNSLSSVKGSKSHAQMHSGGNLTNNIEAGLGGENNCQMLSTILIYIIDLSSLWLLGILT